MSRCPDCGCDLPSFQTLCSKCYDARYAEVGRPKSLLESIRPFGLNPRRRQVIGDRISAQPWWRAWCFAVIGLGLDWRCAFEWFAGKSPFYSEARPGKSRADCAGVCRCCCLGSLRHPSAKMATCLDFLVLGGFCRGIQRLERPLDYLPGSPP